MFSHVKFCELWIKSLNSKTIFNCAMSWNFHFSCSNFHVAVNSLSTIVFFCPRFKWKMNEVNLKALQWKHSSLLFSLDRVFVTFNKLWKFHNSTIHNSTIHNLMPFKNNRRVIEIKNTQWSNNLTAIFSCSEGKNFFFYGRLTYAKFQLEC